MTSSITQKSLDTFVNALNDKRFNARLFGSWIANQGSVEVNEAFFNACIAYLETLAIYDRYDNNLGHLPRASEYLVSKYQSWLHGEYLT